MDKLVGLFVGLALAGFGLIHTGILQPTDQGVDAVAVAQPAAKDRPKTLEKVAARKRLGRAEVQRDAQGHYTLTARLNGRRVPVLVDTGASAVAINEKTARRIGLRVSRDDFRHAANTANGQVKMAVATINSIEIDGVRVRDVQAAILPDEALSDVLLGMSFLNKLDRFEFRDRTLVLYE